MTISPEWTLELRYIRMRRQIRALPEAHMNAQCGWHQPGRRTHGVRALPCWVVVAAALAACSNGGSVNIANSQTIDAATVDYPIFYVKHTVPTTAAGTLQQDDLRTMRDLVPSADLFERASASAAAAETNITARITAGFKWDVKDVDTSADGTKVIFAMRGPIGSNQQTQDPPSWRIWQYTIATDTLAPVINPSTDPDPPTVNDVSPHYLPDGRIVFSSTRQTQSQVVLLDQGNPRCSTALITFCFSYQNEGLLQLALQQPAAAPPAPPPPAPPPQEPAFVLAVMNPDGTGIHQISFNQSHDRDATVLANGRVLWSRWDAMAANGKNQMSLYSANPDGTDLELYYGANSHNTGTNGSVVEFVHPHQMQNGSILAIIRQFTGVDDGGNLVIINGNQYVENTQPLLANPTLTGPAQVPATPNNVLTIPGPSPGGRFTSAFPLQDGTNRILVSWSQCRLLDTAQTPPTIVPCTSTALAAPNAQAALPLYSVWMFDPTQNTMQPIMTPVEGVMVTDVAVAQPRPLPTIIPDKTCANSGLDCLLLSIGEGAVGAIDIRSVYDFDGVDTAVPDIPTLANGSTPASQRPARFIRLEKAVSIPDPTLVNLSPAAFGASNYMIEILGYAPIEPDGSVRILVPGNAAFRMSVLDASARRITPVQGVWLQVAPGDFVSCNGCHLPQAGTQHPLSHGRAGLFNSAWPGAAGGAPFPNTILNTVPSVPITLPETGETMAQTRMRDSCFFDQPPCAQMVPSVNVVYTDVWTDPAVATPNPAFSYRYQDLTTPPPTTAPCLAAWTANCRIQINYPEHIQPLWDTPRANGHTCTQGGCHGAAGAGGLNLTNTASTAVPQQFTSYQQLLFPRTTGGAPVMIAGSANASTLFFSIFAPGGAHAGYLTPAELRLVSEWVDIGAQYFNNPFDPAVPVN